MKDPTPADLLRAALALIDTANRMLNTQPPPPPPPKRRSRQLSPAEIRAGFAKIRADLAKV